VTTSLTQMIIDDEILASVDRIRRSFEVNADSLAVDVIGEVMRGGRNFLIEMHTVSYLRGGEISEPKLATRDNWEAWENSGRVGMVRHAEERMAELLAEHEVEPLSEAQEVEMRKVIRAEERGQVWGRGGVGGLNLPQVGLLMSPARKASPMEPTRLALPTNSAGGSHVEFGRGFYSVFFVFIRFRSPIREPVGESASGTGSAFKRVLRTRGAIHYSVVSA